MYAIRWVTTLAACAIGLRVFAQESVVIRAPVTPFCVESLTWMFERLVGEKRPTVTFHRFDYVPRALDQLAGYAEITFPDPVAFDPEAILGTVYARCSASTHASIDVKSPLYGELLQNRIRRFQEDGMVNISVRLKDDTIEVSATDQAALRYGVYGDR